MVIYVQHLLLTILIIFVKEVSMKPSNIYLKFTLLAAACIGLSGYAYADFVNGGFEEGTMNGWTLQSGKWNTGGQTITNNLQYLSTVITDPAATDYYTNNNLKEVLQGNDSFRLNDHTNDYHFSVLSQTVTGYSSPNMYLGFAAVLENPLSGHTEAECPKFNFDLLDVTTGQTLYNIQFDSRNASSQGVTWNAGYHDAGNNSTWMYSDWNIIHVDTSALEGDTFKITVSAYDCALGGHGGYAYVDSFQPDAPVPNPGVPTHLIQANTLTPVPEPGQIAASLLIALGAGGFMIRKARRNK